VQIRKLLPLAEKLKVVIGIENVWNKFLLSPIEFARYVDEFKSPFLRAYFDVGNVVLFGYPQDWIRTLGSRIIKLHVKGFDAKRIKFVNLRDGTIDWPEVRRALKEINYSGFMSAELAGGDREYLKGVSERMDKIIAGE
jgi:L-ribulose-5-phosphate 3-epimerase